ncbi:alpha-amylase family glycosyl hydrolase [Pararhodonellum marinum]|uniref:alpha-amylase family glycosyl hydrolase n=1 Tax=Pararhodonellum marinum TaxID=2755358 RepID=UPI00188E092A|nr:alpha-amylase family glycosyl hydrolase [Pararhodonellum marinum]
MRKLVYFGLITLLTTMLISCQESKEKEKTVENHWPHAGITYEIFIQSFYDSSGDGIGDINGVIKKLDHVKDLGANAIWFMPIMPSPSYHKYDVTDYKNIHPDYGTLEDFKKLLEEAHARDIKIVIDLIINHTSDRHPWFLEAKKGSDNPYRDYYVWAKADTIADFINKKTITLDSDNIRQWHDPGYGEDFYYGFFVGDMPDLNFDNPKVREEIYEIGRFWLEEIGVDGFRLDAAKHIFPDDRPEDNHAFWKEFRSEMEKIKPDVYLVGEVYDMKEVVAPYLPGLPALFNFDFHYTLLEAYEKGDGMLLAKKQKDILDFYDGITDDFIDATFSSNHDQPRLLSKHGNDPKKLKQSIAVLMTMPGAPYLYYGEEIGMLGEKPDPNIREPFLWDLKENDSGRATWIEPKFSKDQTVKPLAVQKSTGNSFFGFYKEIIRLRNSNRALALGKLELTENSYPKSIMAYERSTDNQSLMVFHNLGAEPVTVQVPENYRDFIFRLESPEMNAGELILPGFASAILE